MTTDQPQGPKRSLATAQRSLGPDRHEYPLEPALTAGCPESSTEEIQYPVGVEYDYDAIDCDLFESPLAAGLDRWQPLLPPLAPASGLGAGNTPLVRMPEVADWLGLDELWVKDESQNPTWSHKDRLVRVAVSAAVREGASGVVVSSTGNHGAATAAAAARADLPCVVLTAPETPEPVQSFMRSYGAAVVTLPSFDCRQEAVDRLAEELGFHPVSSRTPVHTGHAWGPEGYKTIAYEIVHQLDGTVPGAVAVPTCYAELLYGLWKGFRELDELGVVADAPRMIACEPGARAPLKDAFVRGERVASVEPAPTAAYSIKATTSSVRGMRAVGESDGLVVGFSEATLAESQHRLADAGLWQESSGAAGVAGLRTLLGSLADERPPDSNEPLAVDAPGKLLDSSAEPPAVDSSGDSVDPSDEAAGFDTETDGPVVAIATSSGFKDGAGPGENGWVPAPEVGDSWETLLDVLEAHDGISL